MRPFQIRRFQNRQGKADAFADFQRFIDRCRLAQETLDKPALTTDVIVGFPGETEDEWDQTLGFVQDMGFGHLHIFAYSARTGTKAAGLPNPVPREVKRRRSQISNAFKARDIDIAVFSAKTGTGKKEVWGWIDKVMSR